MKETKYICQSEIIAKYNFTKKIIALLIAILIVAIMLVISITLRQNHKPENTLNDISTSQNAEVNLDGGSND